MEIKTVEISKLYGLEGNATLKCFLPKISGEMERYAIARPALIIAPGGGYAFVSEREGDPIAADYYARGYATFVLSYSIAPDYHYPVSLTQLAAAVDYVRTHASEFAIDEKKVYAMGFSAGAHLVGCLANMQDELPVPKPLSAHIDGVVLSYPVIRPSAHIGSFFNLFGTTDAADPRFDTLALDKKVSPRHPPCFIWITAEDNAVDPVATAEYAAELIKQKVRCECHIFPYGWHGSATCDDRTLKPDEVPVFRAAKQWIALADDFLKSL